MKVRAAITYLLGLAITALAAASPPALAQTFPSRPIKLIVPFPAGGPTDVMARMISERLSAKLGTMVVENRTGAGGILGARMVATAPPDGYTLQFASTGSLAISPAIYPGLDYDPIKAFDAIATVAQVPYVLVVHPSVPATSVKELVEYAKANPGKLNFGAATAAPPHISCEMFKVATGTKIVHVPYKGGAQSINDLLGGHVQLTCDQTTVLLTHIEGEKLRPLAVMTASRLPMLPKVPTMVESGYPGFDVKGWFGIVGPAGMPKPIVERLNAEINAVLKSSEFADLMNKFGAEPLVGSPEEFAQFLAKEIPKWGEGAKASGAKIE